MVAPVDENTNSFLYSCVNNYKIFKSTKIVTASLDKALELEWGPPAHNKDATVFLNQISKILNRLASSNF